MDGQPPVLNARQKSVLEDLVDVAERVMKLNPRSLEKMKDHVNEMGTDSDGGAPVDDLVVAMIDAARTAKER